MIAVPGDHFDGSSDRWTAKVSTTLAHWLLWLIPVSILAELIYHFLHVWFIVTILWVLILIVFLVAVIHQKTARLCIKCMQEIPIDADQKAQGWQRRFLRIEHFTLRETFILVVAINVWAGGRNYFLHTDLSLAIASIPLMIVWGSMIYGVWLHHRVRPWCPYCRRWDNGGDSEWVPDPDPAESKKL